MSDDKFVDESWKDAVANQKSGGAENSCGCHGRDANADNCGCDHGENLEEGGAEAEIPVNFFTYMTSMGYQAMIFLGEIPNPMTGKSEKNMRQAKFIIDTLLMLKDKTKGNLTEQEQAFIDGTAYELQMKFVELSGKEKKIIS